MPERGSQFFHGTVHDVEGDLRPGARPTEFSGLYGQHRQGWRRRAVFATSSEDEAWTFAEMSAAGPGRRKGRARVYEVEPSGKAPPGATKYSPTERIAESAAVGRRIDIPPLSHAAGSESHNYRAVRGGVQGTLPPQDWAEQHDVGAWVRSRPAPPPPGSPVAREATEHLPGMDRSTGMGVPLWKRYEHEHLVGAQFR